MLSRLLGIAAAGSAVSGTAAAQEAGFELRSAVLDGKDVCVFVAPQGTAAAVEIGAQRAIVLTGLAAGIVLSDVEEAELGAVSSLGAASSRLTQLSARDADRLIDDLAALTETQKAQLRTALSL